MAQAGAVLKILLFEFQARWLIGWITSAVLQVGVWTDLLSVRSEYGPRFKAVTGVPLPSGTASAIFWGVIIWAILMMAFAVIRVAKGRLTQPSIFWGEPKIVTANWRDGMKGDEPVIGTMKRILIGVRNNPVTSSDAGKVSEAHCAAAFYESLGDEPVLRIDACRWTDNRKPRGDDVAPGEVPKFRPEFETKDLLANNKETTVDFAIQPHDTKELYGFAGGDQNEIAYPRWKNQKHILPGSQYWVRLTLNGVGLTPQTKWLVLRNNEGVPEVTTYEQEVNKWGNLGVNYE
ncbi:hypothetical protein [Parvibaculum sp.]|jgi:hypothetical protein|uniref:hypothetical protein n=1 Tax=Parvibaculum sp. TaxID=2024848 RepID=UPI002FD938B8